MKIVTVDPENVDWPARCCRCGSKHFEMRDHIEKVVQATTLGVTRYRVVGLLIPVCRSCERAHYPWFGAALVLGLMVGFIIKANVHVSTGVLLLLAIPAIVSLLIGLRMKPIKVLGVDDAKGTVRIKVYNDMFAMELSRRTRRPSVQTPAAR